MNEFISVGFADTLVRLFTCMIVNWVIVHFLYFKKSKRRDFYFTFVIILGLGLFGIFSIMRYRTDSMPVREMTYLFVVVCLAVVHAIAEPFGTDNMGRTDGTPITELLIIDAITIVTIMSFERFLKVEASKLVQYDRIELIKPERREELIADLEERLGLKVIAVRVGAVDFLRDMAVLRVYYEGNDNGDVKNMLKIKNSDYASV